MTPRGSVTPAEAESISADGEWVITGGFPTQNVKGVGWKITTTDANSATETFTSFLPLAEQ